MVERLVVQMITLEDERPEAPLNPAAKLNSAWKKVDSATITLDNFFAEARAMREVGPLTKERSDWVWVEMQKFMNASRAAWDEVYAAAKDWVPWYEEQERKTRGFKWPETPDHP
jgi:hypothetical protein